MEKIDGIEEILAQNAMVREILESKQKQIDELKGLNENLLEELLSKSGTCMACKETEVSGLQEGLRGVMELNKLRLGKSSLSDATYRMAEEALERSKE